MARDSGGLLDNVFLPYRKKVLYYARHGALV